MEKTICSDAELARHDRELGEVYKKIRNKMDREEKTALKQDQLEWLDNRHDRCGTNPNGPRNQSVIDCLIKHYQQRTDVLSRLLLDDATYYRESVKWKELTLPGRKKWRKLANWSASCEGRRHLEILAGYGYGIKFLQVDNQNYVMHVTCDLYAYESVYEVYLVRFTGQGIKTSLLKLPQLKLNEGNNTWKLVYDKRITGGFYKDRKLLTMLHRYSGVGNCGYLLDYKITIKPDSASAAINSARGNADCSIDKDPDQWPEIKLKK